MCLLTRVRVRYVQLLYTMMVSNVLNELDYSKEQLVFAKSQPAYIKPLYNEYGNTLKLCELLRAFSSGLWCVHTTLILRKAEEKIPTLVPSSYPVHVRDFHALTHIIQWISSFQCVSDVPEYCYSHLNRGIYNNWQKTKYTVNTT